VGACPVCNDGKDRFKVHFRGEYQDHFFCERCCPPETGKPNRQWWEQVLRRLGLWEERPRISQHVEKQAKESQRISENRQRYEEIVKQRQRAKQEAENLHIRKILASQPREHPIGWVEANDHPGLHFSDHQLQRHEPVTSTNHGRPRIPGGWISWGELYRSTSWFRGWLTLDHLYPISQINPDERKVLLDLSVQSDTYPARLDSVDHIPDVWIAGLCPQCNGGMLFIGALTDQIMVTECPVHGGRCVVSMEDIDQIMALVEENVVQSYQNLILS